MAQRLRTDWTLLWTIMLLVFFGLVMVYSASSVIAEFKGQRSEYFTVRQLGWAAASFFALMYLKRLDYRRLQSPVWAFAPLGTVLVLLIAAYFMDPRAHRWIRLGAFQLQPSEIAKPALIVFLAWFVTKRLPAINSRHTLAPAGLALAVLALIVLVADLGTAVVLIATAGAVFFVAGLDRRYFMIGAAAVGLLVAVGIFTKPYRLMRVINFVDPSYSTLSMIDQQKKLLAYAQQTGTTRDTNYQMKQSLIAVGSGGGLGLGLMQGRQKMFYLPEAHTDFIYAVVGEELGLWGASAILGGFLIILWRGLRLFWIAPDDFGRYLALAVTIAVVGQALINMTVVLGLGPTKGIPLPMISYGGSSLLSTMLSLGMLLSVSENAG